MAKHVVLLVIAIILGTAPVAHARGAYVAATTPGDKNPTIEVASLDDPGSPYWGKYSKLDHWACDNFTSYINNDNYWTIQLTVPNIEKALKAKGISVKIVTHKSYIELDATGAKGYMVPTLAYLDSPSSLFQPRTLGEAVLSDKSPTEEDKRPYFWSLGIQDEAAETEYDEEIAAWLAADYPSIPEWMVTVGHDGDQYSFLPDGGVVIADPDVHDDFSQRESQITRYDASGKVLKQARGDYMGWEQLMLNDVTVGPDNPYFVTTEHVEASGRRTGTSNNIWGTGRYLTYRNAARDGFLAVKDYWQGKLLTPADGDLTKLMVDPYPYFGMVDYGEIVRVHKAQQALAAVGKT